MYLLFINKTMQEKRKKIIIALRKANTSIEKILSRIEDGESECFPVIQQTLSVIGLLRSANMLMLENHMQQTMDHSKFSSKKMSDLQNEIIKIIKASQGK